MDKALMRERVAFCDFWPGAPWNYGELYYWFKAAARYIRHLPREFGFFLERGWYGISWRDCWSLDSHLSTVLPWAVRSLDHERNPRATGGTPWMANIGFSPESEDGQEVVARWRETLETIARGFEAINERDLCYGAGEYERLDAEVQCGLAEFVKWHEALWD